MNQAEADRRGSGSLLSYQDGGTTFQGLYFAPQNNAARSGIMIVPDWRGLSPFVQAEAREFANSGHHVVVVDLYGNGLYADHESQASSLIKALIENRASGVSHMKACLDAFRRKAGDSVNVVALAYSIGGMVSLDFGRSGAGLAGIVLCSGLLKTAAQGGPIKIPCPVLVLHGSRDVVSTMASVDDLVAEMDRAGNDFRFVLYGRAHHAFYNPEVGTDESARLVYSEQSDRAARQEIERFIAQF
jgi:dienelactone hydrolase